MHKASSFLLENLGRALWQVKRDSECARKISALSSKIQGQESDYEEPLAFQCLKCAEGCESCEDGSPCIVTLNWVLRTILLILQCVIIGCLPVVVLFTYKYKEIKVSYFAKIFFLEKCATYKN